MRFTPGGRHYNLLNETRLTVLELVERILDLMGSELKPQAHAQAKNEIRSQYLSAEKARQVLGWQPLFGMDEGLAATIRWYRDYFERQTTI